MDTVDVWDYIEWRTILVIELFSWFKNNKKCKIVFKPATDAIESLRWIVANVKIIYPGAPGEQAHIRIFNCKAIDEKSS